MGQNKLFWWFWGSGTVLIFLAGLIFGKSFLLGLLASFLWIMGPALFISILIQEEVGAKRSLMVFGIPGVFLIAVIATFPGMAVTFVGTRIVAVKNTRDVVIAKEHQTVFVPGVVLASDSTSSELTIATIPNDLSNVVTVEHFPGVCQGFIARVRGNVPEGMLVTVSFKSDESASPDLCDTTRPELHRPIAVHPIRPDQLRLTPPQ